MPVLLLPLLHREKPGGGPSCWTCLLWRVRRFRVSPGAPFENSSPLASALPASFAKSLRFGRHRLELLYRQLLNLAVKQRQTMR